MERIWRGRRAPVIAAVSAGLMLAACGGSAKLAATSPGQSPSSPTGVATSPSPATSGQTTIPPQSPVPKESNPPGDIPDNTVFVPYASKPGAFNIKIPEGWARTTTGSSVSFTSALNGVEVSWKAASSAPTVATARSTDVPALQQRELAFTLKSIKTAMLPGGSAVLITYQSNSTPNPVTGKQYRLEVLRFELFKNGREADLILSSPVGADNVDPWRIVSESFRWA
jgi:hypothetical protein